MTTQGNLAEQIEKVVQEHIAASRAVAEEALSRAFGSGDSKAKARDKTPRRTASTQRVQRRTEAEVAEISERLYQAVCSTPGESMASFAAALGIPTKELLLPMEKLRRAGHVRTVGQRHQTRYFPVAK